MGPRREVVVVVVRDREQRQAALAHRLRGGEHVVARQRDVLEREAVVADQRYAEREPDVAVWSARGAAANQPVRSGELVGVLQLEAEDRAIEQGRLVEEVERL